MTAVNLFIRTCALALGVAAASAGSRSASHSAVKSPIDALDGTRHQPRRVVPAAQAGARACRTGRESCSQRPIDHHGGQRTRERGRVASRHQQPGVRSDEIANGAKKGCPVSRVLNANITMTAALS